MKKIFFALCAVAALASCSNNEIVNLDQEAIAFDNAFVDNATRAIDGFTLTKDVLKTNGQNFQVWGTTTRGTNDPVSILAGVYVTYDGSTWTYPVENTQYWIPTNIYNFAAVKNGEVKTLVAGLPETIYYNATAQADLICDVTDNTYTAIAAGNPTVGFTFEHLLSKVFFSVNNTMATNGNLNYTYRVSNICINNAVQDGTYTVSTGVWAAGTAAYTADAPLKFGNVNDSATEGAAAVKIGAGETITSNNARLLVPQDYDALNITCVIETLYGDDVIDVKDYNANLDVELVKGRVYNFVFSLGNPGEKIEFTVTDVNGWVNGL